MGPHGSDAREDSSPQRLRSRERSSPWETKHGPRSPVDYRNQRHSRSATPETNKRAPTKAAGRDRDEVDNNIRQSYNARGRPKRPPRQRRRKIAAQKRLAEQRQREDAPPKSSTPPRGDSVEGGVIPGTDVNLHGLDPSSLTMLIGLSKILRSVRSAFGPLYAS